MNSESTLPLVSIGLPVYNEQRFIDTTLAALRAQDWPNLEIIVSDNASTDGTWEIVQRHAAQDPRLRCERATQNRGLTANFLHVQALARGDYFMWAGGHDLWSSNWVSECAHLLRAHPDASIAFGSSLWIGADGQTLEKPVGWSDTRGMAPAARLFTVLWGNMHPVMGLMRLERLRACRPMPNLAGGDLVLLSELALRGSFLHAPAALWSRRDVHAESGYADKIRRYASTESGISRSALAKLFPLLKLPFALVGVVLRAPLGPLQKAAVLAALAPSLVLRYLVGKA